MTKPSHLPDAPPLALSPPQAVVTDQPGLGVSRMVLALGTGGIVGMAFVVGDMVSAIFLLFILLMGVRGYLLGAVKIASGIFGLLAAIQWAPSLAPYFVKIPQLINVTIEWNQIPESVRQSICLISAGLLIGLVVILMIRVFARVLFRSKPRWKWADHWLGATFGGSEGIILSAIFLFAALILEPMAKQRLAAGEREELGRYSHAWSKGVLAVTQSVRESSVGKVLESLEPIRTRFDKQMQTVTRAAKEGNKTENTFQGNLMKMVEQMKNDPAARRSLSSRTNMDDVTLRALLESGEFNETLQKMMPSLE